MRLAVSAAAMLVAVLIAASAHAVVVTQWNFNSATPDGNTATGTLLPSIGSGTAVNIGNTSLNFDAGSPGDPASSDNSAARLYDFPIVNGADSTAGMEFSVSTVGYLDPVFTFELRQLTQSSRYGLIQYSLNGVTFTDYDDFSTTATNTFNLRTADLSSVPGADNNPNLKFRIVSAFEETAIESGATSYVTTSGNYSSGGKTGNAGTWRLDMVTLSATAVPEASAAWFCGLGLAVAGLVCGWKRLR